MSAFDNLAGCFATISAYHLHSVVAVCSKQLVEALNIQSQNALVYTSKLNLLRFVFKLIGSVIECIFYANVPSMFKRLYGNVLDTLASEISEKMRDSENIQGVLKESTGQIIASGSINDDSIFDKLLKILQDNSVNIDLKSCSRRIDKHTSTKPRYLDKYENDVIKAVLGVIEKEKKQIKGNLVKYKSLASETMNFFADKLADCIVKNEEVKKIIEKGDNVLYDYEKILAEIIKGRSADVEKIMKPAFSKNQNALKTTKEAQVTVTDEMNDEFLKILKKEIPTKIRNHSEGMERKYETMESAAEIADIMVEKNQNIKNGIEEQSEKILGTIDSKNIREIKNAIMKEDKMIKTKIYEQIKNHGFGGETDEIRQKSEKISENILNIPSIKVVMDKCAPSHTLIHGILEYIIKSKANLIEHFLKSSEGSSRLVELIEQGIKTDSKELVKILMKNIITDIIIKNSAQIAKEKGENKIEQQIKSIVPFDIDTCKEKIKKLIGERRRRDEVIKTSKKMGMKLVNHEEIMAALTKAAMIFGREIREHKEKIIEITQYSFENIIKEYASAIAKNDSEQLIKKEIVSRVETEIRGKLKVRKHAISIMKTPSASTDFRKIVSTLVLTAMLATRTVMLWMVHKSKNMGHQTCIVMLVEALFFGMFQTSLLTIAAEHTATIRLSTELSSAFVMIVQGVLAKLFYKKERDAIIAQMWIVCVLNILALTIWIYWVCLNLNETKNKNSDVTKNEADKTKLLSPYLMFCFTALLKEFLYPKIVPSALITREKSLLRKILLPMFLIGGILIVVTIESVGEGDPTKGRNADRFWLFIGPQFVVCVLALMAIHTKGKMQMYILDNKAFVIFLSFGLLFCYGVMATISYVGVADYVEKTKERFSGYIESHSILCDVFTFIISRLSGGYDKVRKDYGLGMNVLIADAMEPPKPHAFVRECLTAAWKDVARDFKTNISDCM